MKEEVGISRNKMLIAILIATIVFIMFLIPILIIHPVLEVNEIEITSKVFSDSIIPDYHASYLGFDITNLVQINSDVDYHKIGDYKINYEVETGINRANKEVVVHVVDSEPPVIKLKGQATVELCNDNYKEDGYSAIDNYDGDITSRVVVTKSSDKYTYTVNDSSDNTTSVVRSFTKCTNKNETKKTDFYIELKGSQTLYVPLGSEYVEYGATAYDKQDGQVNVIITGSVDNSNPGHYPILYSATNSKGETIEKTRDVYIFDTKTIQNLSGGEKGVIYLTFDDGPSAYTYNILDILDKYNIKATFFVTNSGKDDAILEEYRRGHTVALHTATHQWSIYSSVSTYFADLDQVSDRVYRLTTLTSEVLKRGYHYFDWNVCIEDAGTCAKKKTYAEQKSCVKSYFIRGLSKNRSNVVLMHDIKKYTMESLEEMIQYAIKEGYTFDKINMNTEQIHMRVNN